jgi:hypothetical protein
MDECHYKWAPTRQRFLSSKDVHALRQLFERRSRARWEGDNQQVDDLGTQLQRRECPIKPLGSCHEPVFGAEWSDCSLLCGDVPPITVSPLLHRRSFRQVC